MLPPRNTERPCARSMAAHSETVVVLPLVPVTASTSSSASCRQASSISASTSGASGPVASRGRSAATAMPGLGTTARAPSNCAGEWSPVAISTPAPAAQCAKSTGTPPALRSSRRTRAPMRCSSRAAAMPERPAPTTTARSPLPMVRAMCLSQVIAVSLS